MSDYEMQLPKAGPNPTMVDRLTSMRHSVDTTKLRQMLREVNIVF